MKNFLNGVSLLTIMKDILEQEQKQMDILTQRIDSVERLQLQLESDFRNFKELVK